MKAPDTKWQGTVDRFEKARAREICAAPDGSWYVSASPCGGVMSLLDDAPGKFVQVQRGFDWMEDGDGNEVDVETERELLVCPEHLAIFDWVSHWQAGDYVTLSVHSTREAYEKELRELTSDMKECHSEET